MKNNSINLAFLTVLVISLAFASTPTMNPNTTITATTTLNSKTNGQGDLITVPESTTPVNLNGQITPAEWSDAYNVTLSLYNATDQWEAEFLIKHNNTHILMAEKINDPAVNETGAFMLMVGIAIDLFMIHGQDIMGVAGNPFMGFLLTFDMFQPPGQDPQFDTDYVAPSGTNDVNGNTSYSPAGPMAEWARPLYTGDIYDHALAEGLLFFVTVSYNDGYQPEDSPAIVDQEDTLMFTLGRITVPYSTTPVNLDGAIDKAGEWGDALYVPSILLSNGTESWFLDLWIKFNHTHLLLAMNVTDPTTAGNFTFIGFFENLLNFNITDLSSDVVGILGNNSNTYTETYDYYFSGPPEGPVLLPDTDLGGTNDTYGATYYACTTWPRAEFCHPLNSSDPNDAALQPGSTFLGMSGYGDGWWHFGVDRPSALSPSGAFVLEDINDPVIDSPSDVIYEVGSTGNNITWHPRDLNPDMFNVTQDPAGILWDNDTWDGGDITVNVDDLSIGTYTFTCSVNDTFGNSASDSVIVTVVLDLQDPVIDSPSDITYEEGATGNSITWKPRDANPHMYNITRDGALVPGYSGVWDGGDITVNVDGLSLGTYIFTCGVNDTVGFSASDSVTVVVVDTTSPTFIDPPDDIKYKEGTTGHNITWSATDTHPSSCIVTMNGDEVLNVAWEGENITVNVDGLEPGTYEYICTVYDTSGNSVSDSVTVEVTEEEEGLPLLLAGLAVLIALVIILALLFFRPKGEES